MNNLVGQRSDVKNVPAISLYTLHPPDQSCCPSLCPRCPALGWLSVLPVWISATPPLIPFTPVRGMPHL